MTKIIDSHMHCGIQNVDQPIELIRTYLDKGGIQGACLYAPVEDIYDRHDYNFEDTPSWMACRQRANDYLLELHNIARKKYFEHHRNDNAQKNKLKQNYFSSMEQIEKLINSLPQNQKEMLSKRNDPHPPDNSYSEKYNLIKEDIANDISENPHILTKQLESNFKNDTEETIGTTKDYAKVKALS